MNVQKTANSENVDPNPNIEQDDKENQDKLFNEYYNSHKKIQDSAMAAAEDQSKELTENEISKQIDMEMGVGEDMME